MGCDIHLYREKKINGVWVTADEWADEYDEGTLSVPYKKRAYSGRNYELFGFLSAGVRSDNPSAFKQRGTPINACPEVAATVIGWGCDGHSHSWLGLDELTAARKRLESETTELGGMIDAEQLKALQATIDSGKPDWDLIYPYCGSTNAAGHVKFSIDVPASFAFGRCLDKIIASFDGIEGEDKRIVFFFDN